MSTERVWYYAANGQQVGPMSLIELAAQLPRAGGERAHVYGPGMSTWSEARAVPEVMNAMRAASAGSGTSSATGFPPPPPRGMKSDVIDYEIFGSEMQYVEITLDPGEVCIAEAGGMMYMTPGIEMQTVFGDPSAPQQTGAGGFFGKVLTAGKRMLTGESLFMTTFTASSSQREQVAFASPYPGKIIPAHLDQMGGELICQKDSFLCAARGVQVGIAFQRKLGVGLFGGEGFIMQRLTGDGIAMIHAGGTLVKRSLRPGETLRVDTGCLVALQPSVNYDIQMQKGIKNMFFGGEGLFLAHLTGPGDVWLQSLPFSRLAGRIMAAAGPGGAKEEGSILGGLGGFLDGDNS